MAAFGIFPARRAIAAAPAVCELDRPIMFQRAHRIHLINDIKVPPVLFVDAHIEVVYQFSNRMWVQRRKDAFIVYRKAIGKEKRKVLKI